MVSREVEKINGRDRRKNDSGQVIKVMPLGRGDFIGLSILFLIIIICYIKLPWIAKIGQDGGDGHYAVWAMNAKLLHDGDFPLWNPYGWGGYAGVGHIHEIFYPVLLLLEFLLWDRAKGYLSYMILPVYTLIHVLIFALGLYLLLRIAGGRRRSFVESKGISPLVSMLITFLVTFSGSMFIIQNWPYISGGVYWTPFLLLSIYQVVETRKNTYIVISGLCFAMLALASTAQGLVFAVINYFLLFITVSIKDLISESEDIKTSDIKGRLIIWGFDTMRFIASGFIGMGIAAVEIFPFLETSALSYRYLPGIDIHETVTRIPISFFRESAIGPSGVMSIFGTYVDGYWSMTMVLLFFTVYGFFMVRNHKYSSGWFINSMKLMLIFGLLYTFKYGLVDLLQFVPILNSNREPCLYAPFIVLSGGVLAAGAMERWILGFGCDTAPGIGDKSAFTDYEKNKVGTQLKVRLENTGLILACIAMIPCFFPSHVKGYFDIVTKLITLDLIGVGVYREKREAIKSDGNNRNIKGINPDEGCFEKFGDEYQNTNVTTKALGFNVKAIDANVFISILLTLVVAMTTVTFWSQHIERYGNMTPDMANAHANRVNDSARDVLLEADSLIKKQDDSARYIVYSSEPVLPGNIGFVTGDKNVTAYVNPIYKKTYYGYQMFNLLRQIQLEDIKYILFSGNAPQEEIDFFENYLGRKTMLLGHEAYSSYNAEFMTSVRFMDVSDINLGPAWMVYNIGLYSDADTVDGYAADNFIQILNSETFTPEDMSFVNVDTTSDGSNVVEFNVDDEKSKRENSNNTVVVTAQEANRITYQVDTDRNGLLVTTETYYPGWHVLVDGQERECLEANYKFRAVQLDRGVHEVTFYYAPTTLKMGVATLIAAVVLSVILLIKEHVF